MCDPVTLASRQISPGSAAGFGTISMTSATATSNDAAAASGASARSVNEAWSGGAGWVAAQAANALAAAAPSNLVIFTTPPFARSGGGHRRERPGLESVAHFTGRGKRRRREEAREPSGAVLAQARLERNLGVQQLRYRAVGFRVLGQPPKRRFVDTGDIGIERELDGSDREAFAGFRQRDRGVGAHTGRFVARLLEHQRQRHREAAGVRRGDQLLGIRAGSAFETRRETVRLILEHAALDRDRASAVLQSAAPGR